MAKAEKPKLDLTPTESGGRRRAILSAVDTNLRLFALVVLAMEAGFLAALAALPAQDVKLAVAAMMIVGTVAIVAGVWLHHIDKAVALGGGLQPSPLTPNAPLLNELVRGAIETVCRAVSLPQTPENARIRAFIFRVERNDLVCTHFWSPNPTQEEVGLRFELRPDLVDKIAVVSAALSRRIARTPVAELPKRLPGVKGNVAGDLNFVLAAPIYDNDMSIWGVVDFDTATDAGQSLLQNEVSDQVMFQLARHLRVIFKLESAGLQRAALVSF
jgi:hypothetical protein